MRLSLTVVAARLALAAALFVAADGVSADTITLATPTGLNPGDHFRFLFVTSGTINASSSDISTYNTFVQAQAGGATYGGVTVNWNAIASTASVNARDNVGGFGTTVGVFSTVGGVARDLTTSALGLWSGLLEGSPGYHLDGSQSFTTPWTGSSADGTEAVLFGAIRFGLGSNTGVAEIGLTTDGGPKWLRNDTTYLTDGLPMYALSEELTVGGSTPVPEIDPAGMGSVLALVTGALGLVERRRSKAS